MIPRVSENTTRNKIIDFTALAQTNCRSRALFYRHIAICQFQPYLDVVFITKRKHTRIKLHKSSHRLFIQTYRWKNTVLVLLLMNVNVSYVLRLKLN